MAKIQFPLGGRYTGVPLYTCSIAHNINYHSLEFYNFLKYLQTNTFQAIIITDVFTTYVIYIYKCGELEWTGPPNGHAVIGYNIAGQEFVNEPFSATPDIISVACSNRPFSDFVNIVYDFEANPSKIIYNYIIIHIITIF